MKKILIPILVTSSLCATLPLVACNDDKGTQYNVNVYCGENGTAEVTKNIAGQDIIVTTSPKREDGAMFLVKQVSYQVNGGQHIPVDAISYNNYAIPCKYLKTTDQIDVTVTFIEQTSYDLHFSYTEGYASLAQIDIESKTFNNDIVFKILPIQRYEIEKVTYKIGDGNETELINYHFTDTYTIEQTLFGDNQYKHVEIQIKVVPQTKYRLYFDIENEGYEIGKDISIEDVHNVVGEPEITFNFTNKTAYGVKDPKLYINGKKVSGPTFRDGKWVIPCAELAIIDSHEIAYVLFEIDD